MFSALVSAGSGPSNELLVWRFSLSSRRERAQAFLFIALRDVLPGCVAVWRNLLGIRSGNHLGFPVSIESALRSAVGKGWQIVKQI